MTPEEYEKAFCKGKRQAMEVFNDWLKEHIRTAQYGLGHGVDAEKVLGCTVDAMNFLHDEMEEKLNKKPDYISKE